MLEVGLVIRENFLVINLLTSTQLQYIYYTWLVLSMPRTLNLRMIGGCVSIFIHLPLMFVFSRTTLTKVLTNSSIIIIVQTVVGYIDPGPMSRHVLSYTFLVDLCPVLPP